MQHLLIFDYDGTIHVTMRIYKPAIAAVVDWLREECGQSVELPSDARISSWLGMNTADMWKDFMPELDDALKFRAGRRVGDHMLQNLQHGLGRWYHGAVEMLDTLKQKGFAMAVLSNCGNSYAQAHWDAFHMEQWFTAFFACETWNNAPKDEILLDIQKDLPGALKKSPVVSTDWSTAADSEICAVIGDRSSDLHGAQAAGVPFIGCLYGYGSRGELEGSTHFAERPEEILQYL